MCECCPPGVPMSAPDGGRLNRTQKADVVIIRKPEFCHEYCHCGEEWCTLTCLYMCNSCFSDNTFLFSDNRKICLLCKSDPMLWDEEYMECKQCVENEKCSESE